MMVAVFAAMTVALGSARYGPRWLSALAVALSLALATVLFLQEIHSPRDGFRMPWLQGMLIASPIGSAA